MCSSAEARFPTVGLGRQFLGFSTPPSLGLVIVMELFPNRSIEDYIQSNDRKINLAMRLRWCDEMVRASPFPLITGILRGRPAMPSHCSFATSRSFSPTAPITSHRLHHPLCSAFVQAQALAYLHGRKPSFLIHRDVKPSNFMLTASLRVKVRVHSVQLSVTPPSASWLPRLIFVLSCAFFLALDRSPRQLGDFGVSRIFDRATGGLSRSRRRLHSVGAEAEAELDASDTSWYKPCMGPRIPFWCMHSIRPPPRFSTASFSQHTRLFRGSFPSVTPQPKRNELIDDSVYNAIDQTSNCGTVPSSNLSSALFNGQRPVALSPVLSELR